MAEAGLSCVFIVMSLLLMLIDQPPRIAKDQRRGLSAATNSLSSSPLPIDDQEIAQSEIQSTPSRPSSPRLLDDDEPAQPKRHSTPSSASSLLAADDTPSRLSSPFAVDEHEPAQDTKTEALHEQPEDYSKDTSLFCDSLIDPVLLALDPDFVPPLLNAPTQASTTHDTETMINSPRAEDQTHNLLPPSPAHASPIMQQHAAELTPPPLSADSNVNPQEIGNYDTFTFPPGLFAAPLTRYVDYFFLPIVKLTKMVIQSSSSIYTIRRDPANPGH